MTAHTETANYIAQLVRDAKLNIPALSKPLSRCDLSQCQGTCCHDGVYLDTDEAETIRNLTNTKREFFEKLGLNLPEQTVIYGKWREESAGPKTATRAEAMSEKTADYPAHFADTQCVLMLDDRRCSLQVLAESEGLHRWYYKPFTCWLHPLSIGGSQSQSEITLHDRESDPHNFPDYDGFVSRTPCGQIRECGQPAWQVLDEEFAMLEQISGRNLRHEIAISSQLP
jgi:hypothetical protein